MSLLPVYGQDALLGRLDRAVARGRFPQATLLTGPPGVGKQRIGLRIAQALLCDRGPGVPCEECESCRQVVRLAHPDLHWFVPIARPKASDPAQQVAEAERALVEIMAERRGTGVWGPAEGMVGHPLASVRLLQRKAGMTPFRGHRKVILLGEAERLIVQESSQEAANAILKVLEEPLADTTLVLTAAEPQALLPTIRSRTVPIRVGTVADDAVLAALDRVGEATAATRRERVAHAGGRIGRALSGTEKGVGGGGGGGASAQAAAFLAATRSGADHWTPVVLKQAPWGARGGFTAMLDALSVQLRAELLSATQSGANRKADRCTRAIRQVERARSDAQGNVNPQLTLAVLAKELERLN